MQTATQNLVGFFMEIQHSPSEVEELQEYLEALLEGETLAEGCEWEKKYGMFSLKDFQESFNWTNSFEVEVIDAIFVPDMVRSIPCDTESEAVDMVAFGNIPAPTSTDWEEWQARGFDRDNNGRRVVVKVNNLQLKSGEA